MPVRSERIRSLVSASRFRVGATLVFPERLALERGGESFTLEPRIMEVLVALAERAGEVLSAEQLLIEVWRGTFYGDNPVHRAIAQLRRQLGDDPKNPEYIETIRKRGYRLIAPVVFPQDYRPNPLQSTAWTDRDPYVGLSAFDPAHAEVFFGRTRQTAEALSALRKQRENARGLVLLVGASGCGKSSLLCAGIVPLLSQVGGFDGMHAATVAHCDFAAAQSGGYLHRFAEAIATWQLDQRPILPPFPLSALVERLSNGPDIVVSALDEAWRQLPPSRQAGFALLTIDHAELLVEGNSCNSQLRQQIWQLIESICAHPKAACIMIVRADYYPALVAELPGLAERKGGDGHIDVLPPRTGEIAQIVRMPALLSGLSFEEDPSTALRLDDVLRDAAAAQPDALPLLQHTLQLLYEHRDAKGMLGFATYRAIGGLEGALARRAEETYLSLPTAVRSCLESLLARMITCDLDSAGVGCRRILRETISDNQTCTLVDAFVKARLFVAGSDQGRADVGIAHEALLRQWPRVRDWVNDNRRFLQARARLQRAAARWQETGKREDHLLAAGLPLQEALDVAKRATEPLSTDERALLDASQQRQLREQRLRRFALGAMATLSLVACTMAGWALFAQHESEVRRKAAVRLSDYMLADLAEKLRPLGHIALLDDVGREALAVLGRDDPTEMSVAELINRARALRTMGESQMQRGALASAHEAFVAAEHATDMARARAPDSIKAIAESGTAAYWLGYYAYRRKDYSGASRYWRRYLAHTEELLKRAPEESSWLVERSYALNNLGTLAQDEGRNQEALRHFRDSAALKQRALLQHPNDSNLRFELVDTLSWISSNERAEGQLQSAADGFAEQILLLRALLQDQPTALAWERRLATSLRRNAAAALELGDKDSARAMFDESTARLEALLPKEPENRVWRRDLAHSLLQRAELARLERNSGLELKLLKRANTLALSLASDQAPPAEWLRMEALIAISLAQREGRAGDEEQALVRLSQLVEQSPEDVQGRTALSSARIARGRRLAIAGQSQKAQHEFELVRALLAPLAKNSRDPKVLAPWVQAHRLAGLPVPHEDLQLRQSGYRHPDYVDLDQPASHAITANSSALSTPLSDPPPTPRPRPIHVARDAQTF